MVYQMIFYFLYPPSLKHCYCHKATWYSTHPSMCVPMAYEKVCLQRTSALLLPQGINNTQRKGFPSAWGLQGVKRKETLYVANFIECCENSTPLRALIHAFCIFVWQDLFLFLCIFVWLFLFFVSVFGKESFCVCVFVCS